MGLEIHLFNQAALFRHLVLNGLHGCLEAGFRVDIIPPGPLVLVITSQDGEQLCYQLLAQPFIGGFPIQCSVRSEEIIEGLPVASFPGQVQISLDNLRTLANEENLGW